MEDSQFVLVKIIDGLLGRFRIVAQVAKDFAYMGPVFLFDMSVVVFFVGASTGELDFFLITEGLEVIVDELRAVVGIDALELKRQSLFDFLHGIKHSDLGLCP